MNQLDSSLERIQRFLAWAGAGFLTFLSAAKFEENPHISAFYLMFAAIICPRSTLPDWLRPIATMVGFCIGLALGIL